MFERVQCDKLFPKKKGKNRRNGRKMDQTSNRTLSGIISGYNSGDDISVFGTIFNGSSKEEVRVKMKMSLKISPCGLLQRNT